MRRVAIWCVGLSAVLSLACRGAGSESSKAQNAGSESGSPSASSQSSDACAVFSKDDISAIVGNPVENGAAFAGPEVCKWNAEPNNVSVLLTVRPAGTPREQVLCADLGKSSEGQRVVGLADVAIWKFSNTMGLFNTGELETCSGKGYVGVTLNGKPDEPKLKQEAEALVRKALSSL